MGKRGSDKDGGGDDEDDRALWRKVAATVTAYRPEPPPPPAPPAPGAPDNAEKPKRRRHVAAPPPPVAPVVPRPAVLSHGDAPSVDRRTADRLRRGRMKPEAELDLHGYGRERGHEAVIRFVLSAQARGLRCVRIVTGKGGEGVMRRALPDWLNDHPLRAVVLMFDHAPQAEGGLGAVHVLLRRARGDRDGGGLR